MTNNNCMDIPTCSHLAREEVHRSKTIQISPSSVFTTRCTPTTVRASLCAHILHHLHHHYHLVSTNLGTSSSFWLLLFASMASNINREAGKKGGFPLKSGGMGCM